MSLVASSSHCWPKLAMQSSSTISKKYSPCAWSCMELQCKKTAGPTRQAWINYILERAGKLQFLKKEVPQEELVAIFLKGLHPVPFQQLQVFFAIPGQMPKTFEAVVTTTRKFASSPAVALELSKLKSRGVSQSMFPMVPQGPSLPNQTARCRLFASTGNCRFGARCKFTHVSSPHSSQSPQSQATKCAYCNKLGHVESVCNKKKRDQSQAQASHTTAVASVTSLHVPEQAVDAKQPEFDAEHYSQTITSNLSSL